MHTQKTTTTTETKKSCAFFFLFYSVIFLSFAFPQFNRFRSDGFRFSFNVWCNILVLPSIIFLLLVAFCCSVLHEARFQYFSSFTLLYMEYGCACCFCSIPILFHFVFALSMSFNYYFFSSVRLS